jgi:opacity protein-like surface antigen
MEIKMKKLHIVLIACAASFTASSAFANGEMPKNYFDGFYAGIGVGMEHNGGTLHSNVANSSNFKFTYQRDPDDLRSEDGTISQNGVSSTGLHANDIAGDVFAGFGKTFYNPVYLGGEAFFRYAQPKIDTTINRPLSVTITEVENNGTPNTNNIPFSNSSSIDIKNDFSYGGDIRLGYVLFNRTMIYILGGVEAAKFDVKGHQSWSNTLPLGDVLVKDSQAYGYCFDSTKVAFMPGVGIETMLTDKFSLRAQYTYADFGHIDNTAGFGPFTRPETGDAKGTPIPITETSASVAHDRVYLARGLFTIDLSYHFNGIN